uniref:Uncharacterized protein n=1 Tax=Biomphalaria glabrata TaxID=6526 RepID=A0A2C9KPX8_BIOGL
MEFGRPKQTLKRSVITVAEDTGMTGEQMKKAAQNRVMLRGVIAALCSPGGFIGIRNGKRSDPSLNTENNIPTSLLLRRVLESDPQQINQLLGERSRPELYEENQLTSLEEPSYRSVAEGEISQSPNGNKVDLETMRRYLEAFRLQRAIRESSEDFQ